jgi:hypothetical protein
MTDLIEALFAFVFGVAALALVVSVTVLPWALGLAYMLDWLP